MVHAGHSWKDVQEYTLSEIGEFYRAVIDKQEHSLSEKLSMLWMGANLTHEGLTETLNGLKSQNADNVRYTKTTETPEHIANNWNKMASMPQR